MRLIRSFISFVKKIFRKKPEVKKIEAPKENTDRVDFLDTLKIEKKREVETLVCFGDGLGIKTNMSG